MPTVVLVGTLDTKANELLFVRDRILDAGLDVLVTDAGVRSTDVRADIGADEVAAAAGEDRAALVEAADRGPAVMAMARGAAHVARRLHAEGRLDAIGGIGGSGGSSIIAAAMQALPVGVPKLLVSTVASGDTRPYVGTSDVAMLYSVVDIAGINRLSERILTNAAAALAGMARAAAAFRSTLPRRPVVAATMYGVTTPCVDAARAWLEEHGYEVLVFHATGSGGQAMEGLIRSGLVDGVLDVTTTELTDEVVGGIFSAGPERLGAAAAAGIPQVVSLGATEMGTFGPPESVPSRYRDRLLSPHNDSITLMRVSPQEAEQVGHAIGTRLDEATGPVTVFIPRAGLSTLSVPGGPFADPAADAAMVTALRAQLGPQVEVVEVDTHINDAAFATAMARRLHELLGTEGGTARDRDATRRP